MNTKRLIWYVYCLDLRLCSWWCPGFCYATAHYMPCASDNKEYSTANFGRFSPTVLCWHFSMKNGQNNTPQPQIIVKSCIQNRVLLSNMFLFSPRNLGVIDPIWLALRWGFNFKPPTRELVESFFLGCWLSSTGSFQGYRALCSLTALVHGLGFGAKPWNMGP